MSPLIKYLESLGIPFLPNEAIYKSEFVERLQFHHALYNIIFIFSASIMMSAAILLVIALSIILLILSITTGNWDGVFSGALGLILSPLVAVAALIFPALLWLDMFFQPSTPGYFFTWLILGIPTLIGGLALGGAPTAKFIVIIIPIK